MSIEELKLVSAIRRKMRLVSDIGSQDVLRLLSPINREMREVSKTNREMKLVSIIELEGV